ncbi:MAG: efflux RND transporter periplasmic adaptor subunit [Phenylobacterium sp.]|uniref:efflux RND transporter periplasmic adaptor subunit n=1 Tax=Phenylobacterium sp. TaxID=1871053 RepID=UPI001A55342C|nr:efflux RND transporter periplasmic adaptor subunit [Phenylobacterium sp.]MBL8771138.1 efflux RND transporter periplasmic adaptor subunit [Phenylobacterium sp.]
MKRATFTLLVLLLPAALSVAACKKPPRKETEAERARAVTVVQVEPRAITGALTASGDLAPREEAAVMPEVTGYRVRAVRAEVGDYVRAGQTLAELDPTLLEAQIAEARAQAAQAEDQANRVKGLENQGVLPQEQIAQRRFQAQAAAARLRSLLTQQRKLNVVAPVSGVILERNVRPGDLAAGGATPWFRMARDGQVELRAELSETDLSRVRVGQAATVSLPGGATVTGRVRLISPQINPQTKLGEVRLLLPVRSDIRAGGFGRAIFDDAQTTVSAVPEAAIRYDADGAKVMVVGPDNKVKRVPVQTGARGGGLVQIVKGPPNGTRIVANAGALFLDGDLVRPVAAGPTPAGAAPRAAAASPPAAK